MALGCVPLALRTRGRKWSGASSAHRRSPGGHGESRKRGEGLGPRRGPGARKGIAGPDCARRAAAAAHLHAGAGRARRSGAPASRLPPPARGGSRGARCKQSGGRDVSRSHGASYGSGWLSAGGQLRQLLLWLGRRRRGGGRGGSGIGPTALPALSAPRLK